MIADSTFSHAQPKLGVWQVSLAPQHCRPIVECGVEDSRLCRAGICSGECHASDTFATANHIAERLRVRICQPVSALARWIVDRRVAVLRSDAGLVLPLFQFDFANGCVRSGVAETIAELSGAMTDDEIAWWFVNPNGWLNGAVPANTFSYDVPAVLAAARADRWVAKA